MIRVDLHCHTISSKDSSIKLEALITECDRKGLEKIAITDHNQISGALEAADRWPGRIVPGLEIMTSQGELLAYFVTKNIKMGLTPQETIKALKSQDAVISVSHPFDRWRNGGWSITSLIEILPYLDAIEVFNAHCFSDKPNQMAKAFSIDHNLAFTAGSDAHYIKDIGIAGLSLEDFFDAHGMRQALLTAQVFGSRSTLGMRLISRFNRFNHGRSC